MAREISMAKRLQAVKLYLEGLPYDDIARRLGIGKGSVAAIVEEVRAGRFPQFEHLTDLVNGLRDLAVGLRKAGIAPVEAAVLFTLTKRLLGLGVEPALLEAWVRMCRSVPEEEFPRSVIIEAATKLAKLEQDGLSYEEAIAKLSSACAELRKLDAKLAGVRTEQSKLEQKRLSLVKACHELETEKHRLEGEITKAADMSQDLTARCKRLKKEAEQKQADVALLEKREKGLTKRVPQLEGRAEALGQEITERAEALKSLEGKGFATNEMEKLRTVLNEMEGKHGKEHLVARFFRYLKDYDCLLGMEAALEKLSLEVETLTKQRDSLAELGQKLGLAPDETAEGITALKALWRRNISPPAIIAYQKVLTGAGTDPQSFHKVVQEFGGLEATLTARRKELEALQEKLKAKAQALEGLKAEEARVKGSIATLRESGTNEIQKTASSAMTQITKLCQGLREDITKWGEVRAEMGTYQKEIKVARYFARLPLSEESLSALVDEIGAPVIQQYLHIALAWCRIKLNPKLRPPRAVIRKYYSIGQYTDVELADVLAWALLMLTEGISGDEGRV